MGWQRQLQEQTGTHIFTTVYEQDSFEPVARLVWLKEGLTQPANDEPVNNERLYNDDNPKSPIQVFHYHNDHLGTPNELTNQDGEVIWLADYYAWGETRVEMCWEHILASQGESCARVNGEVIWHEERLEQLQIEKDYLQPIRFQGQFVDTETGLHYNRFRYYDPDLGMFTTHDPIGLLGGMNVFQYAPNPIGWIDPFGLAKKKPGDCDCDDDPCKDKDPAKTARAWQGKDPYFHKDTFTNVVVKKGTILYTLYPHGPHTPNYFVKSGQLLSVSGARAYNDALQLSHSGNTKGARPMRTQVRAFTVIKDTCMGKGKALANTRLGSGGGTQYFVSPSDTKNLVGTSRIIKL